MKNDPSLNHTTEALRPIERRVLAYLDQKGGSEHRAVLVNDLASTRRTGISSQQCARLMGWWCKRLKALGFVAEERHQEGYYKAHRITPAGRQALRAA